MADTTRVLIFDDDDQWAKQIATLIRDKCDATTTTTMDHWRNEARSTHWDVIVVDVQIPGQTKIGTEHAEDAILEYDITSPVIVVSHLPLENVEKRHRGLFFDYIPKDDLGVSLPKSIERACLIDERTNHVKRMVTAFAKKFRVTKKEFSSDLLIGVEIVQMFEHIHGKTVADLIGLIGHHGSRQYLDRIGKNVLIVIRALVGKPA